MKKRNRNIVQADTPEGQRTGEILTETVENQIRDNNPPEVRVTLDRLMAMGESRENAMRYIGSALRRKPLCYESQESSRVAF